jgi:hypothetical protein
MADLVTASSVEEAVALQERPAPMGEQLPRRESSATHPARSEATAPVHRAAQRWSSMMYPATPDDSNTTQRRDASSKGRKTRMIRVEEDDLEWDDNNLPSYEGEPFTGECIEVAADGRLLSLTTYVNGLDEGPFRAWSGDGVLVVEGTSHLGRTIGVQREWYSTGALKVERNYGEYGVLLRYQQWDEDGNLIEDWTQPTDG